MTRAPLSTSRPVRVVVLLQRLYEAPDRPAPALLGQCEAAALATAVRLRDRLGGTLAAVAMGTDAHQQPVLAAALTAGCDRGVRVHAPDCDRLDYLGVATVLAAAVRRLGCDLLLCGDTGENERTGAMGPAMAELLGIAHLSGVLDVNVDGSAPDGTIVVAHLGGDRIHRFRWPLPAALCLLAPVSAPVPVSAAEADARADSEGGADRAGAGAAEVETVDLDQLGLHAQALAHRRRLLGQTDSDVGSGAIMVADADDLVSRLVADGMLR